MVMCVCACVYYIYIYIYIYGFYIYYIFKHGKLQFKIKYNILFFHLLNFLKVVIWYTNLSGGILFDGNKFFFVLSGSIQKLRRYICETV